MGNNSCRGVPFPEDEIEARKKVPSNRQRVSSKLSETKVYYQNFIVGTRGIRKKYNRETNENYSHEWIFQK